MYIPLLQSLPSAAPAPASATTPPTSAAQSMDTMFLQLLTAQLKSQSPIDPLDPNQFVAQLAQFNSLSELAQIHQLLQTLVANTTPTTSSSPAAVSSSIPKTSSH